MVAMFFGHMPFLAQLGAAIAVSEVVFTGMDRLGTIADSTEYMAGVCETIYEPPIVWEPVTYDPSGDVYKQYVNARHQLLPTPQP